MNKILVSILCTAYNHEDYIKFAIEGFVMQKTNFEFEVLINDDCSTDNTAKIIKEYEEKYPNIIKPIYQAVNQYSKGIDIVKEILVPKSNGKYIALCEGDDWWIDENKLQSQVDYLEKHSDCSMCVHPSYNCYENGIIKNNLFRANIGDRIYHTGDVINGWKFPTASIVYKKELYPKDGIPFTEDAPCGDYPLAIYMSTKGHIYYIDKLMAVYRNFSKSSVTLKNAKNKELSINVTKRFISLLERIDGYTNFNYSQQVNKYKMVHEFNLLITQNDYKEIKSEKWKKQYSLLTRKQKIHLFLRIKLPFLNRMIEKFFSKLTYIKNYSFNKKKGFNFKINARRKAKRKDD